MRIITRYILREVTSHALLGGALFTFIIFTRDLGKILEFVVRDSASYSDVARIILYTLPPALTVTIPMAVLVGILLGLSRLAADSEITAMRAAGPKAARLRRKMPAFIRSRTMPGAMTVGDAQERWTFGFLFDIILTRDPFMHRLDISRATGIPVQAAPVHEGVIVDDIVREWAARHGRPYTLSLSGPAGGTWGGEGENITMDAFDFCRTVSGRGPATGLLSQQVPF